MYRVQKIGYLVIAIIMLLLPSIPSYAYDTNAPHAVNADVDVDAGQKEMWNTIRGWGYSEAATAGAMGNIGGECSFNWTILQGGSSWNWDNVRNRVGMGIIQWTSSGRQEGLLAYCDTIGKQWVDLGAQLGFLQQDMTGWAAGGKGFSFASEEELKATTDVDKACQAFCWGVERPGIPRMEERLRLSNEMFTKFSGSPINGSDSKEEKEADTSGASLVVKEWDLQGMPSRSKLKDKMSKVTLPDSTSLSVGENYSVQRIKEDLGASKEIKIFDTIRVGIVFVGLLLIIYANLLLVACIFARVNQFIDISLVSVLTLGKLKLADDKEDSIKDGFISTDRLIKVLVVCTAVGVFIVSGSMYLWITDLILFIGDKIHIK